MDRTTRRMARRAAAIGQEHGQAAASWVMYTDMTEETLTKFFSRSPLSGEWPELFAARKRVNFDGGGEGAAEKVPARSTEEERLRRELKELDEKMKYWWDNRPMFQYPKELPGSRARRGATTRMRLVISLLSVNKDVFHKELPESFGWTQGYRIDQLASDCGLDFDEPRGGRVLDYILVELGLTYERAYWLALERQITSVVAAAVGGKLSSLRFYQRYM